MRIRYVSDTYSWEMVVKKYPDDPFDNYCSGLTLALCVRKKSLIRFASGSSVVEWDDGILSIEILVILGLLNTILNFLKELW